MPPTTHTLNLTQPGLRHASLGFFRFTELAGQMLLTNEAGEFHWLDRPTFHRLLVGALPPDHPDYPALLDKGMVRAGMDLDEMARRVRRKKAFLNIGPHLHIVITTLRCNQSCKYCHASRTDMDRVDTDMSLETARQVVDMALKSSSPYINFEYTGGEPTVNMPVIRFMVDYAAEKNKAEGKEIAHSLVTNMTTMDDEKAQWLIDHDVLLCTSLDGPEPLHNWNRTWRPSSSAYGEVLRWIREINAAYVARGRDPDLWHVDALMTTTRRTLELGPEPIVDLYVSLGIRNIHFRPLNPFGFANKTWRVIGYTPKEYMDFYQKALDYIISLNRQGVQIMEGTASTFLKKMLTPDDPNFVDIRSPIGSGTGQIAYNYDGKLYPSDEGRMVAGMGDDFFCLGEVGKTTYAELSQHPTLKAITIASLLDTLPQCNTCWNAPYCGVMPLHNWMHTGDLFAQRPNTFKCNEHMTISRLLFTRLKEDPALEPIFRRWTLSRPRE